MFMPTDTEMAEAMAILRKTDARISIHFGTLPVPARVKKRGPRIDHRPFVVWIGNKYAKGDTLMRAVREAMKECEQ